MLQPGVVTLLLFTMDVTVKFFYEISFLIPSLKFV